MREEETRLYSAVLILSYSIHVYIKLVSLLLTVCDHGKHAFSPHCMILVQSECSCGDSQCINSSQMQVRDLVKYAHQEMQKFTCVDVRKDCFFHRRTPSETSLCRSIQMTSDSASPRVDLFAEAQHLFLPHKLGGPSVANRSQLLVAMDLSYSAVDTVEVHSRRVLIVEADRSHSGFGHTRGVRAQSQVCCNDPGHTSGAVRGFAQVHSDTAYCSLDCSCIHHGLT